MLLLMLQRQLLGLQLLAPGEGASDHGDSRLGRGLEETKTTDSGCRRPALSVE